MAAKRIRAIGGLSTSSSPLDTSEALRTATNVSLARDGLIEPRFGVGDTTGIASRTTSRRPIEIVPFAGDLIVQSKDGSTYSLERGSVATVYSADVAPPDTALRPASCFAQSRGSLYLTTDSGVQKLEAPTSSALGFAGVRTDYVDISSSQREDNATTDAELERYALVGDSAVAYRYVWVSEDANGYVRRSAPSARFVVATEQADPRIVEFTRLYLPTGITTGDRLELYRTENVTPQTSTPGTEYLLALTYTVTSTNAVAGYIEAATVYDDTPDSQLGAALYTNPSQGGIQQANEIPPLANSIAEWAGVMWYGNVQLRHAISLEIVSVGDTYEANDPYGVHAIDGLMDRPLVGSFTNASANVTTVTTTTGTRIHGMKVGQYIYDSIVAGPTVAGIIPALTKIASITSTVSGFDVTTPLLAPGDTITVFGHTFTWSAVSSSGDNILIAGTAAGCATNLASKIGGWDFDEPVNITASSGGTTTVTITEDGGHGVGVSVTGTGQTVGYSLTMNKNATGTSVGFSFVACDFVTVNGVEFFATCHGAAAASIASYTVAGNRMFAVDCISQTTQDYNDRCAQTAVGLARAINAYAIVTDTSFGVRAYRDVESTSGDAVSDAVVTFIRQTPDLAAFSVRCLIKPTAFRPELATSLETEDARFRNRLCWSKVQEPEAVPFLHYTDIGRRDADIIALVPLDDTLLVWKEDGLFSVSGSAPSAWVVDEVDVSIRLLAPRLTCVLDGVCYAWTDRGLVAVTSQGMPRIVSGDIGDTLRSIQVLLPAGESVGLGFHMVAQPRLGLVAVALHTSSASTATASRWYVLHTRNGRWARWGLATRCAAYDPFEDKLVASTDVSAWYVARERTGAGDGDPSNYRDAAITHAAAVISGAGLTVTIPTADFLGHTPAIGDVLVDFDGLAGRVTAVQTVGSDRVLTVDSAISNDLAVTWHQAIATTVEWQAQHQPGFGARWGEFHGHFTVFQTAYVTSYPLLIGGLTERSTSSTASTVSYTVDSDDAGALLSRVVRVGPPREIVRATHLYPHISTNTAGAHWRLADLVLHGTVQSRRVSR